MCWFEAMADIFIWRIFFCNSQIKISRFIIIVASIFTAMSQKPDSMTIPVIEA